MRKKLASSTEAGMYVPFSEQVRRRTRPTRRKPRRDLSEQRDAARRVAATRSRARPRSAREARARPDAGEPSCSGSGLWMRSEQVPARSPAAQVPRVRPRARPSPRYFQRASVSSAGASPATNGEQRAPACERAAAGGGDEEDRVRRLDRDRVAAARPAAAGVCQLAALERAQAEVRGDEQRRPSHGKSGTDGQPDDCGNVSSVYFWW